MQQKIVSCKKEARALVFQDNLLSFEAATSEFGVVPASAINPILVIYFNILKAVIELEDGNQIDVQSEKFDASERHFWGGELVKPTVEDVENIRKHCNLFLGQDWENNASLQLLRFELNCGNCDLLHEVLLPFTSQDVHHSQDEWDNF